MKKLAITSVAVLMLVLGLSYADQQSEDGLIEDIKYMILPDPMANNTYDEGQCTYYVFDMVKNDLNMIDNGWGDAEHWAERAEADGYQVDQVPAEGSVLHTERGALGHVAYVTGINDDNSIEITEMNFYEPHEITERTIEAENIEDYNYIHPEENPRPKDTIS